jgi:hypothetical protein
MNFVTFTTWLMTMTPGTVSGTVGNGATAEEATAITPLEGL